MAPRQKGEGFGFIPAESEHHFLVTIPLSKEESIYISEHLTWDNSDARRQLNFALGHEDSKMRVVLPRYKWEIIADAVRAEFNQRLRRNGLKMGKWGTGQTPLSRLFGKELVLLAWAIEDADPALIPIAIKNWLGLAPEERWWLFTMTNAATGHAVTGRNKGWPKAVRYALTENPISEYQPQQPGMALFEVMEAEAPWASSVASVRRKASPDVGSSTEKSRANVQ